LRAVRVLIFHGYLLRGTGSNVYNAELAQALARQGHEVHLLCQDRHAKELDWVRANDNITVHIPDIGGLLPVYVADRYEGFEVKTFPEMSDEEIERYIDANVAAVRSVVDEFGEPDAALANHLIMGPAILARAGLEFAVKVHGSDLSYVVVPHPDRFVPYAREGTDAAAGVLAGSSHTARQMFDVLEDPGLPARTRLGPPGVDTEHFKPEDPEAAATRVESLANALAAEDPAAQPDDSFVRDGPETAEALRAWLAGSPRALFVGKFLVNKGVDLLAAAWPLVHRAARESGAQDPRLLLVGFGEFEEELRELLAALGEGDIAAARDLAPRPILAGFLADPPEGYAEAARAAAESVLVAGRLEHDEVGDVMPAADVFTMPSTFPESFGMVPAESAACGVPPVSADHSGMREVSRLLDSALDEELQPLLRFEVGPGAVSDLADKLAGWLDLDPGRRHEAGAALSRRVHELWSWDRVARGVVEASRGELHELPEVAAE
jgi:glycosyltransferase involved in cell wall biosynthesis